MRARGHGLRHRAHYESERVRQAVREFRSGIDGRTEHRVTGELDERLHSAYKPRAS